MTDAFIGEIRLFSAPYVPAGWLPCDGRVLTTTNYQALFSLIGYQFGGSGSSFNLPDLRGTAIVGNGANPATGIPYNVGAQAGTETVTLTLAQMPLHTHQLNGVAANGPTIPTNGFFAQPTVPSTVPAPQPTAPPVYAPAPTQANQITPLNSFAITNVGASAAHENRQPFLVATYGICITGLYPQRQ